MERRRNEAGEFVTDDTELKEALLELIDICLEAVHYQSPLRDRLDALRQKVEVIDTQRGRAEVEEEEPDE